MSLVWLLLIAMVIGACLYGALRVIDYFLEEGEEQ